MVKQQISQYNGFGYHDAIAMLIFGYLKLGVSGVKYVNNVTRERMLHNLAICKI